jgi:hypothetical protein
VWFIAGARGVVVLQSCGSRTAVRVDGSFPVEKDWWDAETVKRSNLKC